MAKFRKKPVVVEAVQILDIGRTEVAGNPGLVLHLERQERPEWLDEGFGEGSVVLRDDPPEVAISTLEGVMVARTGDFIIQGVKGELYPCKPDIFSATYEEVI